MHTGNFVGSSLKVMEKEFIPYEQALALKELGFDEPCFKGYTEEYKTLISFSNTHTNTSVEKTLPTKPLTAPLYQQAFRWFREKYGCEYSIKPVYGEKHYRKYRCNIYCNEKIIHIMKFYFPDNPYFDTYEEAELECLKRLIEIVRQKLAQVKN